MPLTRLPDLSCWFVHRAPYAHTLSLRLTADQYRRLRRWVAAEEDHTGKRTTHQAVFEIALAEFMDKRGG